MTDSLGVPLGGVPLHHPTQPQLGMTEPEGSASAQDEVHTLLTEVDGEIELLRQRLQTILMKHPASESSLQSRQRLEDLVVNLREANEHLVIASLDASIRATKTAESHRQQTLFLSMLAHELRNPLAPIAMSVELLRKMPGMSPAIQSLLQILHRQTNHLVRLVDDLMDATRINSGKLKIKKSAMLASEFIEHAIETSQPQFKAQRQQLELNLPQEQVWVHGDSARLSQMLSNLLLNASKFSAEGTSIHLSGHSETDRIILTVRDEGIGISPERQPFIFDLFNQGAVGEGLLAKGLGIGLSLVRTIAELHGGTVDVTSRGVGHGSEFRVSLPILQPAEGQELASNGRATPAPGPVGLGRAFQAKRILLIDDNEDINKTLGEFLSVVGHEVDFAMDGPSGLQMAGAHHYDIVCCDIGLPGMSGREVARRLQDDKSSACLIAISGYDQPEQRQLALEAGFHHYLIKPIFGKELLALIADVDA